MLRVARSWAPSLAVGQCRSLLAAECMMPTPAAATSVLPVEQTREYAHWYSGKKRRHRLIRDLKFNPRFSIDNLGRNRMSRRLHYKSNRWNYKLAYKDTP